MVLLRLCLPNRAPRAALQAPSRIYQQPENALNCAEGPLRSSCEPFQHNYEPLPNPPILYRWTNCVNQCKNELIAVNQTESALDLLNKINMNKRTRGAAITVLEPILLRFIELAVLLRKRTSSPRSHSTRNSSERRFTAIELVTNKFIGLSGVRVAEAQTNKSTSTMWMTWMPLRPRVYHSFHRVWRYLQRPRGP
ncbi:hypothetical protein BC830DRAFT_856598 [Chytriomyces sp. MP71]|nr:hypothetical protein BC830DRAFT_856598 [Chytriomyces sp. MP71]